MKSKARPFLKQVLLLLGAIVTGFIVIMLCTLKHKCYDRVKLDNIGSYPFKKINIRANGDTSTIPILPAHSSKTIDVHVIPEASLHVKFTDHLNHDRSEDVDCYLEGGYTLMHLTIDSEGKIQVLPDSYGLPLQN